MKPIKISLPFPPSVNTCWRAFVRNGRPTTILSKRGREFRAAVLFAVRCHGVSGRKFHERLSVRIDVYAPDKRRRDVDNLTKAPLDALTHAGVWLDDSQIDDLRIIRREVDKKDPRVDVTIEIMEHRKNEGGK